jgi:hypothetical protein
MLPPCYVFLLPPPPAPASSALSVTFPPRDSFSQSGALPDLRLFFSFRRSDGQNQHVPQALDLSQVDLVPSYTASAHPKVSTAPYLQPLVCPLPRSGWEMEWRNGDCLARCC